MKKEYVRDVGKLKKRVEDAEKDLDEARAEITRLRTELLDPENEEVKRARGAEGDLSLQKKIITRHQKELEKLTQVGDVNLLITNFRNLTA